MRGLIVFSVLILLGAVESHADILFLDMNDGKSEVAAAQRAARARGEKLIVYPGARARARATEADESEGFGKDQLQAALADLNSRGVKISTLVISGHDGNGDFHGEGGDLGSDDIRDAFNTVPAIRDGVQGVALWGCYTATMGQVEGNWKATFPNAKMIAGYEGAAPLSATVASPALLEGVLRRESQLVAASGLGELNRAFRALPNVNITNAALCTNSDLYVSMNSKTRKISTALGECRQSPADLSANAKFQCYLNAETGCDNVPTTTGSGPLRELYNHLQSTSHCDDVLSELEIVRPSRDVLIRLIFEKTVRENFQANYKTELADLDERMKRLGFPPDLKLSDLASLSRKDFLDRIKKIGDLISAKLGEDKSGSEDLLVLSSGFYSLQQLAGSNARMIPFGWVEPHTPDNPAKPAFSGLVNARFIPQARALSETYAATDNEKRKPATPAAEYTNALAREQANETKLSTLREQFEVKETPQLRQQIEAAYQESRKIYEDQTTFRWSSPSERALVAERIQVYEGEVARLRREHAPAIVIEAANQQLGMWEERKK